MEETKFKAKLIEIAGFAPVLQALRLPFGKECRSDSDFDMKIHDTHDCDDTDDTFLLISEGITLDDRDRKLLSTLVKRGDEHAKVLRGVQAWFEITAPRFWWQEFDTYRIGVEKLSSESTMHIQGQGLSEEELVAMKEALTEGTMQKRIVMLSYQALRRIWIQRHNHRLPHWRAFCDIIKTLPFAKDFILAGLEEDLSFPPPKKKKMNLA